MTDNYPNGASRRRSAENQLLSAQTGAFVQNVDAGPSQAFNVLIAPNGTRHTYTTVNSDKEFTQTPHAEFLGDDVGIFYGYSPMDDSTRTLYGSLQALNRKITSVSILPQEVSIDGFEKVHSDGTLYGKWPYNFDFRVVSLLASHLGFTELSYNTRHQSVEELRRGMDDLVRKFEKENPSQKGGWTFTT